MKVLEEILTSYFDLSPHTVEPVDWPFRYGLEDRQRQLALNLFKDDIQPRNDYSAATFCRLERFSEYRVVTIRHIILLSTWDEANLSLIRWYVKEYWGSLATHDQPQESPQFVIFLNIQYQDKDAKVWWAKWFGKKPDNRKATIERLEQECRNQICPFKVMNELTPIERQDLGNWCNRISRELKIKIEYQDLENEIFPKNVDSMSMGEVEKKLKNFLTKYEAEQIANGYISFHKSS